MLLASWKCIKIQQWCYAVLVKQGLLASSIIAMQSCEYQYFKQSFDIGDWWVICVQIYVANSWVYPITWELRNDSSVEKGLCEL